MYKRSILFVLLSSIFLIGCSNNEPVKVESEETVKEEFTPESFGNSLEKEGYKLEILQEHSGIEQGDMIGEVVEKLEKVGEPYEYMCSEPCFYLGYSDVVIKFNSMETAQYIYSIKDKNSETINTITDSSIKKKAKKYSKMQNEKSEGAWESMEKSVEEYRQKQEQEEIESGTIRIGMTKVEVLERWGKPQDINRTITATGTDEQWVYPNYKYLYFEDGILTTIQD